MLCDFFKDKCKTKNLGAGDIKGIKEMEKIEILEQCKCKNCKYAKPQTGTNAMWFCGKHRTYITELTQPLWITACKGKHYEEKEK